MAQRKVKHAGTRFPVSVFGGRDQNIEIDFKSASQNGNLALKTLIASRMKKLILVSENNDFKSTLM